MDNLLKNLFEYQKFEEQPELQRIIDGVHTRYAMKELTADDLEYVAAAGSSDIYRKNKQQER